MKFLIGIRCRNKLVKQNRRYLLFDEKSNGTFKNFSYCQTYTDGSLEDHILLAQDYDTKEVSEVNLSSYVYDCLNHKYNWNNDIVGITITYGSRNLLVNFEIYNISSMRDKLRLSVLDLIYKGIYSETRVNLNEKVVSVLIPNIATSLAGGVVACTKYWGIYNTCGYGDFDNAPRTGAVNLLADLVMEYIKHGVCHCLTLVDNTHSHKIVSSGDLYGYLKSAVVINKRGSDFTISLRCPIYEDKYAIAYKEMNWTLSKELMDKILIYESKLNILYPNYLSLAKVYNNRLDVKNWNLEEFLNGKDA